MDGQSVVYTIDFAVGVESDIIKLKRSNPLGYRKLQKLITELSLHPRVGTGHPEALKGGGDITWSRHITTKDRLVYDIYDDRILVLVIAVGNHYNDK